MRLQVIRKPLEHFARHLRANPGVIFALVFEALLIVIALELWLRQNATSNDLGIIAFAIVLIGLGLQTMTSIRAKSKEVGKPNDMISRFDSI